MNLWRIESLHKVVVSTKPLSYTSPSLNTLNTHLILLSSPLHSVKEGVWRFSSFSIPRVSGWGRLVKIKCMYSQLHKSINLPYLYVTASHNHPPLNLTQTQHCIVPRVNSMEHFRLKGLWLSTVIGAGNVNGHVLLTVPYSDLRLDCSSCPLLYLCDVSQ